MTVNWVEILALVLGVTGLVVGSFAALLAWKLAHYVVASERVQVLGMENIMRLVIHIGRETDTIRQTSDPTVPPNTTLH